MVLLVEFSCFGAWQFIFAEAQAASLVVGHRYYSWHT
jgi:hypothetical protein